MTFSVHVVSILTYEATHKSVRDVIKDDPTLGGGALPTPALQRIQLEEPPSIYDEDDELSLVRALTGKLKVAVQAVPAEFRVLGPKELIDFAELDLTRTDYALRTSFWREYGRAMGLGLPTLETRRIFAGVCSESQWKRILDTPGRVAWLVLPQLTYQNEMEAILGRATTRLWELIEMDVRDPKTKKTCPRRAELLLKVITMVNDRVKGMAVQRVERKTATLRVTAPVNAALAEPSLDELRRKHAELEESLRGGDRGDDRAGDGAPFPAEDAAQERTVINVTPVRSQA